MTGELVGVDLAVEAADSTVVVVTREDMQQVIVDAFTKGIDSLLSAEWGGLGPERGKSLERKRAWSK